MSRQKGNRTRKKAIKYLKKEGWLVDIVELTGKFRKYKDCFAGFCINCWTRTEDECCDNRELFDGFDLLALKSGRLALIQLKTNTPPTQKGFKKFAKMFANSTIEVWAMTWYNYKGFRMQIYQPDEIITETWIDSKDFKF